MESMTVRIIFPLNLNLCVTFSLLLIDEKTFLLVLLTCDVVVVFQHPHCVLVLLFLTGFACGIHSCGIFGVLLRLLFNTSVCKKSYAFSLEEGLRAHMYLTSYHSCFLKIEFDIVTDIDTPPK